mmetsp:Transcript_1861/g.5536  ORF Transcript_1861/g.5536 Transcript_1861/m.5536 type:complete len:230 (+) Transcript_1861:576-1265(+)
MARLAEGGPTPHTQHDHMEDDGGAARSSAVASGARGTAGSASTSTSLARNSLTSGGPLSQKAALVSRADGSSATSTVTALGHSSRSFRKASSSVTSSPRYTGTTFFPSSSPSARSSHATASPLCHSTRGRSSNTILPSRTVSSVPVLWHARSTAAATSSRTRFTSSGSTFRKCTVTENTLSSTDAPGTSPSVPFNSANAARKAGRKRSATRCSNGMPLGPEMSNPWLPA